MLHWDHGYNKDSLSMRVLRPTRLLELFESCSWGVAKLARHRPLEPAFAGSSPAAPASLATLIRPTR